MYQSHHPVPAIVISTLLPTLEHVAHEFAFKKLPEENWLFYTFMPDAPDAAVFCLHFDGEIQMLQQGPQGLIYTGVNEKFRNLMEIHDEKGLVTLGSLALILSYSGPERAADYVQQLLEITSEEEQQVYQSSIWRAVHACGPALSQAEDDPQPAATVSGEGQPASPNPGSKPEQPRADKPSKAKLLERYSKATAFACVAVTGFVLGFWAGRRST